VGPGGGTLGIGAAAITIPPGALTADVPVSIAPIAAPVPGASGQVFEIEPSGTQFNTPATVTFSYANYDLAGLPPSAFAVSTVVGGAWQALPGQTLDANAQTISATTMHLSPYGLVAQAQGGSQPPDASAPDATVGVNGGSDSGGASSGGVSSTSDGGTSLGGGASSGGGSSSGAGTSSGGGSGCATAPAAAVSPPSSASSTNVIASQGATINIQDGYAQIVETVTSGALNTTYATSLGFTFTDYPNALGYAQANANKQGSRTLISLDGENWTSLSSMTAQPQFAAGTYSLSGDLELYGFTSTCSAQDELLLFEGTLTISSITSTRIQGSLTGVNEEKPAGSDAGAITINFDIPLKVTSDGGGASVLGVNCCLP